MEAKEKFVSKDEYYLSKIRTLRAQNTKLREAEQTLQKAYDFFSPISNQWEGRTTQEGQWLLSQMRSALEALKKQP